jgi:surface antigen
MHRKSLIGAMVLAPIIAFAGSQTQVHAVERCAGIYSPGNPYDCYNGGNCVWWTWHWLRWGKGDRSVPFRYSAHPQGSNAHLWDDIAQTNDYIVDGNLEMGAIAVNETSTVPGTLTGHVAVVVGWNDTYLYVDEMHWGRYGLWQRMPYRRSKNYFTKFIHPKTQPKLFNITPQPFYASSDMSYLLRGENLDRVTQLEITFPSGGKGYLSGRQIQYKDFWNLQMMLTLGGRGRWTVNAITDQNVESYPMPFDVQ